MNPNKPIDRQDVDEVVEPCENYEELVELGEASGLSHCGINDDGEPEFIGKSQDLEVFEHKKIEREMFCY